MQNVSWDVVFDCYTQKAVFAKILARDALVGNKMVFRVEIEMKVKKFEMRSCREKGVGKLVQGPPVQAIRLVQI